MFTVCVGLVFRSKYVQFPIICFLQYSININTVKVDPHSELYCIFVKGFLCENGRTQILTGESGSELYITAYGPFL